MQEVLFRFSVVSSARLLHATGYQQAAGTQLESPKTAAIFMSGAHKQEREQDMQQRRLLILEDDEAVALTIGSVAKREGYEVRSCASAEPFFREHDEWLPTHVAVDLMMPGMDGVQVLRKLAEHHSPASVIVTSGMGTKVLESVRKGAVARGLAIIGILPKPFRNDALRSLLKREPAAQAAQVGVMRRAAPGFSPEDLDHAIRERQFLLHYQPKVNPRNAALDGFEALLRWQHPEFGLIYPDDFIGVAEGSGRIDAITDYVFDEGARWMRHLWNLPGAVLELNMSATSFTDIRLADQLEERCSQHGISPSSLVIELTESSQIKVIENTMENLARLRIKGFGLAIDDFGIGYSSMEQLVDYPFSELKIDKTFVKSMTMSAELSAVVETTIRLARELGMTTVAEGVEDQEALDLLAQMGCNSVQGYYVARPMPGEEARSWIAARR